MKTFLVDETNEIFGLHWLHFAPRGNHPSQNTTIFGLTCGGVDDYSRVHVQMTRENELDSMSPHYHQTLDSKESSERWWRVASHFTEPSGSKWRWTSSQWMAFLRVHQPSWRVLNETLRPMEITMSIWNPNPSGFRWRLFLMLRTFGWNLWFDSLVWPWWMFFREQKSGSIVQHQFFGIGRWFHMSIKTEKSSTRFTWWRGVTSRGQGVSRDTTTMQEEKALKGKIPKVDPAWNKAGQELKEETTERLRKPVSGTYWVRQTQGEWTSTLRKHQREKNSMRVTSLRLVGCYVNTLKWSKSLREDSSERLHFRQGYFGNPQNTTFSNVKCKGEVLNPYRTTR